jgi:hypothetical protein
LGSKRLRGLAPGGYVSAHDDVLYSILDMDFAESPFHALW